MTALKRAIRTTATTASRTRPIEMPGKEPRRQQERHRRHEQGDDQALDERPRAAPPLPQDAGLGRVEVDQPSHGAEPSRSPPRRGGQVSAAVAKRSRGRHVGDDGGRLLVVGLFFFDCLELGDLDGDVEGLPDLSGGRCDACRPDDRRDRCEDTADLVGAHADVAGRSEVQQSTRRPERQPRPMPRFEPGRASRDRDWRPRSNRPSCWQAGPGRGCLSSIGSWWIFPRARWGFASSSLGTERVTVIAQTG